MRGFPPGSPDSGSTESGSYPRECELLLSYPCWDDKLRPRLPTLLETNLPDRKVDRPIVYTEKERKDAKSLGDITNAYPNKWKKRGIDVSCAPNASPTTPTRMLIPR